jgi:hypothetical protein
MCISEASKLEAADLDGGRLQRVLTFCRYILVGIEWKKNNILSVMCFQLRFECSADLDSELWILLRSTRGGVQMSLQI